MFQAQLNDQFAAAQAKAIENAKHLAQVAVESAQELAEINQAAAKDAVAAAQETSAKLLAVKDLMDIIQKSLTEKQKTLEAERKSKRKI